MRRKQTEKAIYSPQFIYKQPYKFDKYDKKLLKELDINARKQLSELSRKVGLSRDAIRNRIKKLQEHDVISAFKPIYNPPTMGYPIVNYVFIALSNPSEAKEEQFLKHLMTNKHVTYVASLIGKWDFILDIMAENQGQFDKVIKKIRYQFHDIIKDYEIYGILQEYKYEELGKLIYE